MKNGRPRPTLVHGAAIYANAFEQFSRPMTGHTPQKLPRFRAISCIIAVRVVIPTALEYDTTPLPHCQALFREKYQNLCMLFGQNRDLVSCTTTRYFWHLFRGTMKHFSFPRYDEHQKQVIPLWWNHLVLFCRYFCWCKIDIFPGGNSIYRSAIRYDINPLSPRRVYRAFTHIEGQAYIENPVRDLYRFISIPTH